MKLCHANNFSPPSCLKYRRECVHKLTTAGYKGAKQSGYKGATLGYKGARLRLQKCQCPSPSLPPPPPPPSLSLWQHVSTAENPADACSRGPSPMQLAKDETWWEGPEWLKQSSSQGIYQSASFALLKGTIVNTTSLVTNVPRVLDCEKGSEAAEWKLKSERFSDWYTLVRLLARVKHVVFNMRNPAKQRNELKDAENDVICNAQHEALPEDSPTR